jgi:outer membrane protein assembly factor BamB
MIDLAGAQQIVTMTEGSIVGLEGKTGKELWSAPFPDEWHENIATPLWTGTNLIVSGTRQGTHAYTLAQSGGKWQATESGKNPDIAMYMSSPVFGDGLVYGHSSKKEGTVLCDGRKDWRRALDDGGQGRRACFVVTDTATRRFPDQRR